MSKPKKNQPKPTNSPTANTILAELQNLEKELANFKKAQIQKMNFFDLSGMGTKETHHSTFFANMLDVNALHGLNNSVLKRFCEKLYNHVTKDDGQPKPTLMQNHEILTSANISKADLDAFVNSDDLKTEKELSLKSYSGNIQDSRLDIIVYSEKTKTLLVIENKVGSTVHDDQLVRYENALNDPQNNFAAYNKKIFVFLSPNKDVLPYNIGGNGYYNDHWCVMDYETIGDIISDVIKNDLKNLKQGKTKLKTILEDYIEYMKTNILNLNTAIYKQCQTLWAKYPAALTYLKNYVDNTSEVLEIACDELTSLRPDIHIVDGYQKPITSFDGRKSVFFYSDEMEQVFTSNGETYTVPKLYGILYSDQGNIKVFVECKTVKCQKNNWSPTQLKIIKGFNAKAGNQFCKPMDTTVMISPISERAVDVATIEASIRTNTQVFVGKFNTFESILKTI